MLDHEKYTQTKEDRFCLRGRWILQNIGRPMEDQYPLEGPFFMGVCEGLSFATSHLEEKEGYLEKQREQLDVLKFGINHIVDIYESLLQQHSDDPEAITVIKENPVYCSVLDMMDAVNSIEQRYETKKIHRDA